MRTGLPVTNKKAEKVFAGSVFFFYPPQTSSMSLPFGNISKCATKRVAVRCDRNELPSVQITNFSSSSCYRFELKVSFLSPITEFQHCFNSDLNEQLVGN